MDKTLYVLYGEIVCSEFDNGATAEEIANILDNSGIVQKYDEQSSVIDVLANADGWYNNRVITEEFYNEIQEHLK